MQCPKCQFENREEVKFCEECGAEFELECPSCKAKIPLGNKFCGECGYNLKSEIPPISPSDEYSLSDSTSIIGERRQVTVLFSDLSGYTAMSEKLDPEEVKNIMSRIFREISHVVTKYGGITEKYIGDAVMALFGMPKAHEDDPLRAIWAAREIHEIIDAISPQLETKVGRRLSMHTGINSGLVVTGEVNLEKGTLGVTGDTINIASRLSGLADPGDIFVGQGTYHQTEAHFTFERLKSTKVKGKAEAIPVFKVSGAKEKVRRLRGLAIHGISSLLVGRDAEFTAIKSCVNRLLDGQGGILSITGEAGIGKSRLITEVNNHFSKEGDEISLVWLEGRTLSYGQNISYWPFREIIRQFAEIKDDDSNTEAWKKLESKITELFAADTREILPYLASLLTLDIKGEYTSQVKYLDGEAMGRQVFLTSRRFFERLSQNQPLVLVFEDLHWIDESSMLLLEHLLPLVNRVPLLICGISRPEPKAPTARLREVAVIDYKRRYTEFQLSPLPPSKSSLLMQNLLEIENLPPYVREMILRKAEGNPFFLEEIMRSLIDSQGIEHDTSTGRWRATSLIETITIPDTIQGIIMARVDRLDKELKQVLCNASVIGRSFLYRVLQATEQTVQEIDQYLDNLHAMELIREKQRIPELEYIFKHALVQESTYESILLQKRRKLHLRVAQAIETLFSTRLEEFYSMLAHHYVRAEKWEKAQDYLMKAGDQAARIAADAEALSHYRQAIEAFESVFGDKWNPLQRASLDRKMGEAFHRRGEHERAIEFLQRTLTLLGKSLPTSNLMLSIALMREIAQQIIHRVLFNVVSATDRPIADYFEEEFRTYESLAWIESFRNYERFILVALRMLNRSERNGFLLGIVTATMAVGLYSDLISFLRLAGIYHRRAIALAQKIQNPKAISTAYFGLTLHNNSLGKYEAAIECGLQSAKTSRETGDIHGWGWVMYEVARASAYLGNFNDALAYANDVVRIGREAAASQVLCWGLYIQGFIQNRIGQLDAATAALKESCSLTERTNDFTLATWAWTELGRVFLRKDQVNQALSALEAARKLYTSQLLEPNAWISQVRLFNNSSSPQRRKIGKLIYHWFRKRTILLTIKSQFWNVFRHGNAEAYLHIAEQSAKSEKGKLLKKAGSACREALRHSKPYPGQIVEAMRMKGTYEWLRGKPVAAKKWWQRSLTAAEKLGMRYEMGLAYLERGKRLGEREPLEQAEAIFVNIGAKWDLSKVREALSKL